MSSLYGPWPGHDDAEAGGADPGPDHKGAVQEDVDAGLGLNHSHLSQTRRHSGYKLQIIPSKGKDNKKAWNRQIRL